MRHEDGLPKSIRALYWVGFKMLRLGLNWVCQVCADWAYNYGTKVCGPGNAGIKIFDRRSDLDFNDSELGELLLNA